MIAKIAEPELFSAGRLSSPMSELLREQNEKPRLDWEKAHIQTILQVDSAHIVMLAKQNLVRKDEAAALLTELENLKQSASHDLPIKVGYGSMVLQVERIVAKALVKDVAGNVPIARSRLDQGATVRRIADRENILHVLQKLVNLQQVLLLAAQEHRLSPMVSYTHLQQAQPAVWGHYFLAFGDRLTDCFQRLLETYSRTNRSPLGAVGLSGTDLNIDRNCTATLLGFDEILENSRLGRDGYYQIEIAFALAMIMTVLNDLCTELHIYSSTEFGTVELDDSHCSTSSIFPQKKNPYALETIKGKAGESQGWVAAALATFRNEGTIDHAARSVGVLDNACMTTANMLSLMSEIVEKLTVHAHRSEELLDKAWVTTNRLANVLMTNHGLTYRTAHSVVARLTRNCLQSDVRKADVTAEMLEQAALEMNVRTLKVEQAELESALSYRDFIDSCVSFGGIGVQEISRMTILMGQGVEARRSTIEDKMRKLAEADLSLKAAVKLVVR